MTYPADRGPAGPDQPDYPPQPQYPYPQEPAYPQQPAYPGYPTDGYPPAQYPPAGYPGEPGPPPRRRTPVWIWVAVGVAATVAVALLVVFVTRDKHPGEQKTAGRSLHPPASFDGYQRMSGFDTTALHDQLGRELKSLGASASKVAKDAVIAVYAKPGASRPQFVLLAFPLADIPDLQDQVKDVGLDAAVRKFMSGISGGVTGAGGSVNGSSQSFDPGPLGGAMRCQQVGLTGNAVGVCAWGDRSYFAMNLMVDPPSLSTAADTTRDLRTAAEG
ncbi:MAG TPA: hypothetical protein VFU35_15915 [Jatrophihabitans sp.]|nr:hypothetical protein [Jatrophihabitans sp.]